MTPTLLADVDTIASFDAMSVGLVIIRVIVGVTFAAHGYNKFFGGGKIAGTARWFSSIGMRPNGTIHAYLAASTELGGGLLFAAGLLTPLAAAGMVGVMLVAGWTSRAKGFFIVNSGWEYNLVLATIAIGVATIGPGKFSLDWVLGLGPAFDPNWGLGISGGLGIASGIGLLLAAYRPPPPEPTDGDD